MNTILKIILLFFSTSLFSQDFLGKVEYQTIKNESAVKQVKVNENKPKETTSDVNQEEKNIILEAKKKAYQKKFILTFNKNESLFEQVQELEKPKPATDESFSFSITLSGMGNLYTNVKENYFVKEEDLFEEEFLVKDTLHQLNWTITEEVKKIGDYNCIKATCMMPVSDKAQAAYNNYLKKVEKGEQLLFVLSKPEPTPVVAWYTPDVPVNFGPKNFWGLPGLILQLEDEMLIYLCTKVTIKNAVKNKIKVPKNGKKVTKKEFEKLQVKMQNKADENNGVVFYESK